MSQFILWLGKEVLKMGNFVYIQEEKLNAFCQDAFEGFGFSPEEAGIIKDVLMMSDMYGIQSHGMQRVVRYHKGIEKGLIDIKAKPEVVFETPVSAVVEGHDAMGQLVGHFAMELAIKKAKESGIGIVSARNSNHYGIAGYYADLALKEGLIGFSCTNSEAIMVPTFARKAMLGSNPIAFAMPAEPYNFFFDASTTVVTRGKLEMYNKLGKELPNGWALNKDGKASQNAAEVLGNISDHVGGGIMPLGGNTEQLGSHKGYGYGMLCEIFASIFSQGGTSNKCMTGGRSNICHGFMAINPAIFGNPEEVKKHFSTFLQELREAPKAEGAERIYTHGEKEAEAIEVCRKEGVPVIDKTVAELFDVCNLLKLDPKKYFGDYEPPKAVASNY
ncbi:Ldh family oxidoreductase [Veillonella sp. 3627]|uniref:Ldh family oxidoreductase n=2 Tax=Veillonella TaxID=29465 RepID=UPI00079663E0|nr:Ldh family oxidoreductase [Veillonella sp. 3627]KXB86380.1 malate/L-lactate dehydrogenase [Veillonella sp. DNF00869]